ncbi:MAG: class I SAM-dependent methyltransferase [Balneolaceae bacterium]|nr:class I SAM-dependent methyltransferase [Balneolaceae bacterium]
MKSRFSQQSDLYARYRPDYPPELYDFITDHVDKRSVAWDCATGTGIVAATLANYVDKVLATDISREQMQHAPDKANITYTCVPAEDTGFPDHIFDLITVGQAIHWFDFKRFYEEVRRVARDGAVIAVFGYGMIQVDNRLNQKLHAFYDEMFGRYFNENRRYLDEKYQTIPFPFDEISTPRFRRRLEWSLEELEGFLNSWSPVQQYKNDTGSNPVNPLLTEIMTLWDPGETKTVTFPIFLRLGRISANQA